MKNRAALLALIVLAIATLLMIFVILPRLSGDQKTLQEVADEAAQTTTEAAETTEEAPQQAVAQLKEKATATLEKMERLSAGATEAVGALAALFDGNRLPAAEDYAAARAKAENVLADLAAVELPEGIGGDVLANAQRLRDEAVASAEWVKTLPENPAAAAPVIDRIRELFPLAFTAENAPEPAETPVETEAESPPAPVTALPTFDVLRVEPDGSTLIAGRATPGVTIEIVSGENVLTKAETGAGGEFAAILDDPLPPGDHQLALRATGDNGAVALSGEVATISVPKDKDGQLLAMISTPGQASRLLAIPSAQDDETSGAQTPDTAAPGDTAALAPDADAAGTAPVRVSAVEIESNRIYVAGSAAAGSRIRAFASDTLIGEGTADPSGHFVVDGAVTLAPGDHVIVVETLDAAGNVVARVSVPFNRPAGSQVSAIAGDTPVPGAAAPLETADTKALAGLRENVAKAFTLLRSLFADGKVPSQEELAAARSATEFALKALSEYVPDPAAPASVKALSAAASADAARAQAALDRLPRDPAGIDRALGELSGLIDTVTAPAAGSTATALSQAPLTPSDNAVIIRRGDTLWQISRRVYGQGVRYTTIYLANRNEILNPDLIEPGQVFTVPREALPNAEELHRRRLSGEALQ
ncbi:LysM peptidoglycan-binding domain-containing protein [Rhizobiaceae bacterium BDR2-2]|uniref:LysM peptidoglycan-binding domain-containing protein n=1 Tax=Ectorhizobium quercum TaxID=2965071 RepID=A0AAE3N374_9HYPH|nr:LysM peptidoglycan-binding domain-containing protein [Ectorhizobium quercum]MCX8999061.1 LysM peptidoglycan-binding domain-containing protein [Ectorhizobium quercum]